MDSPRDTLERELQHVARQLRKTLDRQEQLYEQRTALLRAGRALDPPITQSRLAALVGATEEAVTQVLRKAQMRDDHAAGVHTGAPVPKCPECKREARAA